MNTHFKKIAIVGASALMVLSMGSVVFAENTTVQEQVAVPTVALPRPEGAKEMVLEVGPKGKVLLRGTVSVVGANSLTVKSWGGDWVVNTSSTTKFASVEGLTQFKVGDFVGVQGQVSTTAAWTIDASLVRNWMEKKIMMERMAEKKESMMGESEKKEPKKMDQNTQQQIQSILEQIKKIQAQLNVQQGQ